jgi:hypothetical protein
MGSDDMIYIPSFIKIGSGIRKIMRGIHRHTDTYGMEIAYAHFQFFKNMESRPTNT